METNYEQMEKILDLIPVMSSINKNKSEQFAKDFITYLSDKYDFVSEIEMIIGFEKLIALFYIFSGKTIEFPDKKQIKNCIRDMDIYYSVKNSPTMETCKNQAKKFEITNQAVLWIIERVSEKLGEDSPIKDQKKDVLKN